MSYTPDELGEMKATAKLPITIKLIEEIERLQDAMMVADSVCKTVQGERDALLAEIKRLYAELDKAKWFIGELTGGQGWGQESEAPMTYQTDFEKRYVPVNAVLVMGGTYIDDTFMDLLALAELAENDPKAARELAAIEELISAELMMARERAKESEAQ